MNITRVAASTNSGKTCALAGMSRACFAVRFRAVTGRTPADHLAGWRVLTAQRLFRRGLAPKRVAFDVGYGSASAFTRGMGASPTEWPRRDAAAGMRQVSMVVRPG